MESQLSSLQTAIQEIQVGKETFKIVKIPNEDTLVEAVIVDSQDRDPALPFPNAIEVLQNTEYASTVRVMFKMLMYTGCRITELDNFRTDLFIGNIAFWQLGKNQSNKSPRHEELPWDFIQELIDYRKTHRVYSQKLFAVKVGTFKRYFNRDVRPRLSQLWNTYRIGLKGGHLNVENYLFQLKGLRKSFQTNEFRNNLKKYDDAQYASEKVAKRMNYNSSRMSAFHYQCNVEILGLDDYDGMTIDEITKKNRQKRIFEFQEETISVGGSSQGCL